MDSVTTAGLAAAGIGADKLSEHPGEARRDQQGVGPNGDDQQLGVIAGAAGVRRHRLIDPEKPLIIPQAVNAGDQRRQKQGRKDQPQTEEKSRVILHEFKLSHSPEVAIYRFEEILNGQIQFGRPGSRLKNPTGEGAGMTQPAISGEIL